MSHTGIEFPQPDPTVPITIYYKEHCPYSNKARLELQKFRTSKNSPLLYHAYSYNKLCSLYGLNKNAFFKELKNVPQSHRTFPVVFNCDTFLGGSNELSNYLNKIKQ